MRDPRLQSYIEYYERLTPVSLEDIGRVMTDDVHFSDPFNDVTGLESTRRIFAQMFDDLDDVAFKVLHAALADDEPATGLLSWRLDATIRKNGSRLSIEGMSSIRFAPDGRVCEHIDHWDAGRQVYERLPLLGALLRWIRSRLAA